MGFKNSSKSVPNKSWRQWTFRTCQADTLPSRHSPSTRKKSSRFFHKPFTNSAGKRTVSFDHVPGPARPKSEEFSHARPNREHEEHTDPHLAAVPTRSTSAPVSMTTHRNDLAMSPPQTAEYIPLDSISVHQIPVPDNRSLSSVNSLDEPDVNSRVSPPEFSSAAIESSPVEPAHGSLMDTDQDFDRQLDATDSESVPPEIFNLGDSLSYRSDSLLARSSSVTRPSITRTLSEVLESLKEIYGPSYQQADDIAGIALPESAEPVIEYNYTSPPDMMIQFDLISVRMSDEKDRMLRESIAPWLPLPSLYSEIVQKATSSVDKQMSVNRLYVSSWIFVSLAMSRVDGLRFMFTIWLSFWIYSTDAASFSVAEAAVMTEQHWITDASNLAIEHSGYSSEAHAEVDSTSLSEVAHVTSRLGSIWSGNLVLEHVETSSKSTRSGSRQQMDRRILDAELEESVKGSVDDVETELPLPHIETQPNLQQNITFDSQQEDSSLCGAISSELISDVIPDNKESQITLPSSQSDTCVRRARSQSSSPGRTSPRRSTRDEASLHCKYPLCEKTFVNQSELQNHMDVRHKDADHSSYEISLPALPANPSDQSALEHSKSLTEERSRADEQRIEQHPSLVELKRRRNSLFSRGFSVRSGKEGERFFVRGRVFIAAEQENLSSLLSNGLSIAESSSLNLSIGSQETIVDPGVQRFVVVRAGQGYCLALPIYTIDDNDSGVKELSKTERHRYAIIYDDKELPKRSLYGPLSTRESIPVEVEHDEALVPRSVLDFDKPQTVWWETRVKSIGMVKGESNLSNLMLYLIREMQRNEEEESIPEDNEGKQRANASQRQRSSTAGREPGYSSPSTAWA